MPPRSAHGLPRLRFPTTLCRLIFLLVLAVPAWAAVGGETLAQRVIVLANSRQPESVRLAQFYADKRAIPRANIIALPMPEEESITWRTFIDQVYQPLQDELIARGWLSGTSTTLLDGFGRRRYGITGNRISYLVVCRGTPLRIYNDPTLLDEKKKATTPAHFFTNEAAVDSELSLLAQSGYDLMAMVVNPLLNNERPSIFDAEAVVKVSRLDGPTWESARALVTSALEAEKQGLIGRAYLDLGGPHRDGDVWLEEVGAMTRELGYDQVIDPPGQLFGDETRFDAPALYFGWYTGNLNGPFKVADFRFPPGAIALHIHSFSAQTLRSDASGWTGPFVARGVTATVGNVFEPYLQLTHRPNLLMKALVAGRNWGDAIYYALPALSWQCVAIGDPLYEPFKISLRQQVENLPKLRYSLAPYVKLREANQLVRADKAPEAVTLLKQSLRARPDVPVSIALAKLLLAQKRPKEAVDTLAFLALMPSLRAADWTIMREVAGILAANDARPVALKIYTMLVDVPPPSIEAKKLLLKEARAVADAAADMKRSLEFARLLNELNPPPPPPASTPTAKDAAKK